MHLFKFSLFGSLYQQLFMFCTPKLFLQTTFITIDALWKYLEYFCKPVATCSTVGALKISVKIHACSEALSKCLSLVYIFPSFSPFHIIPVTSTHLSLSSLNIQVFYFLPKNIECVSSSFKFKPFIYDTHSQLLYILYVVCEVCIVHYNALGSGSPSRRGCDYMLRLLS